MLPAVKINLKMQSNFFHTSRKNSTCNDSHWINKLSLQVGPLRFSSIVDFSFRPTPSYGRRSMISLISHWKSVLQTKPISWTSSRTQSYRSPNTTQTPSPTTCKCIEATDQTPICTFKSFPIGSLCPAAYLSNSKQIFPNKFIYSNNQTTKDCFHSYQ